MHALADVHCLQIFSRWNTGASILEELNTDDIEDSLPESVSSDSDYASANYKQRCIYPKSHFKTVPEKKHTQEGKHEGKCIPVSIVESNLLQKPSSLPLPMSS